MCILVTYIHSTSWESYYVWMYELKDVGQNSPLLLTLTIFILFRPFCLFDRKKIVVAEYLISCAAEIFKCKIHYFFLTANFSSMFKTPDG